ncbi:hypothetical protein MNEG_10791, partial [Monoraphidium neglectum]
MGQHGVTLRLVGFVFVLIGCLAASPALGAFLQGSLPLEPVLSTPAELLSN